MKKQMALAVVAATLALAGSAPAQICGPAPCAPVVPCPPVQKTFLIPNTTSCYRTTGDPCLNPVQGVTNVLGKIFAPTCFDTCKPCVTCP